MKKLILLFAFVLVTVAGMAKTNNGHLKFDGVTIDGTVERFVSRLEKKGFKGDLEIPGIGGATTYVMSGKYLDRYVQAEVIFDGPTRIVHGVVLQYGGIALERAERELQYLREQIIKQYGKNCRIYDGTDYYGNPVFSLRPMREPGSNSENWDDAVGEIRITITEDETADKEFNPERYGIKVRFSDGINSDAVSVG